MGIVMLGTVLFWFLPGNLGARNWYRGEIKTRLEFDSVSSPNFSMCGEARH